MMIAELARYGTDWWELQLTRDGRTVSGCVLREAVSLEEATERMAALSDAERHRLFSAAVVRANEYGNALWRAAKRGQPAPRPDRTPNWPEAATSRIASLESELSQARALTEKERDALKEAKTLNSARRE
jgi:hypothetical protein